MIWFNKILKLIFQKPHHDLEIYVLDIEENYLTWQLSWFVSAILLSKMKLLFFSLWKFSKFLVSFLESQVSFPSNFAPVFSAIKHNSSVFL